MVRFSRVCLEMCVSVGGMVMRVGGGWCVCAGIISVCVCVCVCVCVYACPWVRVSGCVWVCVGGCDVT